MNKKLLAVIFGAGLMLAACGGGNDEANDNNDTATNTETPTTETATVDAEKIVNSKCISCHGGNLEGQGNFPALNDVGARLSEDEILNVIENGKGAMPGGLVSGEEAQEVAAWLAAKK
ncbi:cytochrome c551 [Psychrobacillus sp. OK032]|uniref:cytochrome c551 n=1 Tax=Psychrobacillus sp. OK032 TaxID=1884358 RepID=UPI0008BDF637|nr:cytochrome c [Psychrobacillus sp. OK032]SER64259.1 cytochrome c551 [Psychrobacillus sp. OK032]